MPLLPFCVFFFLCFALQANAALSNRTVRIGPGFYNIRAPFDVAGLEIGTQMSLAQLPSGKFLIIDTVEIDATLKSDIDFLTKNGDLIEGVIASHPFHTTYFPAFYQLYPRAPFYGTPRHLRIQPQIPWKGNLWDCDTRQKWLPDIHMRIPRGSEFVAPEPESDNHFSGIHILHSASKTIAVDDTIVVDMPFSGDMIFHPTLITVGLYHVPEAPKAFGAWVEKLIREWDFENICAAHNGVKIGGAKEQLKNTLSWADTVLSGLEIEYTLFPNEADAKLFEISEAHEKQCKE